MDPRTLSPEELTGLLSRQRRRDQLPDQVRVHELFEQILAIANRFVPSEAGTVLIDDPSLKVDNMLHPSRNELVCVACFGERADEVLGSRQLAGEGVAGLTYLTGQPSFATGEQAAHEFAPAHEVHSMISVPIQLGQSTCGVVELLNRVGSDAFEDRDLELLLIFAGYISTSLQNVLDANRYRELAKRDDLTGLYNDRFFNQALSRELQRVIDEDDDLGLIFLDLDHFKQINDVHGHLVGSQTLREVGLILKGTVTPETSIVARYGGDEFVIILPGYNLERTREVAESIRERIESAVFRINESVDGSTLLMVAGVITASIGISSYRAMGFEDETFFERKNLLIRHADQSMYKAKAEGKNRVCDEPIETGDKVVGFAGSSVLS